MGTMENRGREKEQMQAVERIHMVKAGHRKWKDARPGSGGMRSCL